MSTTLKQRGDILYFVPMSISGLAYYERLIPYLGDAYAVGFLLIGYEDAPLRHMVEYCQQKNYVFYTINLGLKKDTGMRIPLFSPLKKMLAHKKECQRFFGVVRPAKLVFNKTTEPYGVMAHEANCYGVETIILQCALMAFKPLHISSRRLPQVPLVARMHYFIVQQIYTAIVFLHGSGGLRANRAITPKKLGMIDEASMRQVINEFDPVPEKVRIVGTLEMQEAYDLRKRVLRDASFRESLQKKYTINTQKTTIVVLGFRLTRAISGDGKRRLSEKDHVAYFRNIFADIWHVFPKEEVNILFKMHPGDGNAHVYESYKFLGVSIYGDATRTDELVSVSELCIIDPWTAANYLISASGIPTICVDFAPVQGRVVPKEDFNIKEIVSTRDRFQKMLKNFKEGMLVRQYNNDDIDVRSADKIINLINS